MKSKVLMIVAIAILVVAIIVVVVVMQKGNNGGTANTTINLEELNTKLAAESPFNEMATQDTTTEELGSYFQVNVENVEKVVGKIPLMNVHASMYMVIEAKEGKVEEVKTQVETYGENYEKQWERYLPEQYELVKNRKIGTVGNYVYLIIAENRETLQGMIK